MTTNKVGYILDIDGETIRSSDLSFSGTGVANIKPSETIPADASNLEINFDLDVSACVFFYMVCTVAVLVETNSGSSPDNTLTLVANQPYIWHTGSYDAFKFTTDIASLFVTESGSVEGELTIYALYNPTP